MTPFRERIEALTRLACHECLGMEPANDGDYLKRSDVLAALDEPWTNERPTAGHWWVAIHPDQRGLLYDEEPYEIIAWDDGTIRAPSKITIYPEDRLVGAIYMPRNRTPRDPFADKSEDKSEDKSG